MTKTSGIRLSDEKAGHTDFGLAINKAKNFVHKSPKYVKAIEK